MWWPKAITCANLYYQYLTWTERDMYIKAKNAANGTPAHQTFKPLFSS